MAITVEIHNNGYRVFCNKCGWSTEKKPRGTEAEESRLCPQCESIDKKDPKG